LIDKSRIQMAGRPASVAPADQASGEAAEAFVDVLIAAHDRADTIERAVMSALAEDHVQTVIVVDDGSTDDTARRASRCDPSGRRVIVERLPSNLGPSAARNAGLRLSRTGWIAVLDADDYFLPGRLDALLSRSDGWDLVADDIVQVPEGQIDSAPLRPILFGKCGEPFALGLEEFVRGNVRARGVLRTELGFLKPIMRRSFLDRHGLRYDERLRLGEDYALYTRALAAGGRFLVLPRPGYASVLRDDSLSALHSRHELERLRDSDAELLNSGALTVTQQRAVRRHYVSIDCRVQWLAAIEAFKTRSLWHFLELFFRSATVSKFLVLRLVEESLRRIEKRLKSAVPRGK